MCDLSDGKRRLNSRSAFGVAAGVSDISDGHELEPDVFSNRAADCPHISQESLEPSALAQARLN